MGLHILDFKFMSYKSFKKFDVTENKTPGLDT